MQRNKTIKTLILCGLVIFTVITLYVLVKPLYQYKVNDNPEAIKQAISDLLDAPIIIHKMEGVDNIKIVLFSKGSDTGEAELIKGPNKKLKLRSAGYGTNTVRYRIMNTDSGQYVRFIGRNDDDLRKIIVFVDEEKYTITVPHGDYFISYVALNRPTTSGFPSASVWYDSENKEIARINIPSNQIIL